MQPKKPNKLNKLNQPNKLNKPNTPNTPLHRWGIGVVLLVVLLGSYPWVINRCAFYPERENPLTGAHLPVGVEEVYIDTADGERLHCYWLPQPDGDRVVIYFHGNAGHIGYRMPELQQLAALGLNVLGVGYRGYGNSSGRPTEAGIYADGRAALHYVTQQRGYALDRVFVLGRSIGSTVAVEIGRAHPIGGMILVTPLTSGKAMARAHGFGLLSIFAGDRFNNLEKITRVRAPLLILHGTEDTITPFYMGQQLYDQAVAPKRFVTLQGGGHNDIGAPGHSAYWDPIAAFIRTPQKALR
ncbi:MAG: alpha/beta hydrolase [Desulfatitalea sp.]|nr:alpha/beta hydrolase [Desulfatitalea sp.]